MEDSKIIDLFFERSEEAIIALSEKYGSVCMRVSENIVHDCRDAEECVNEAYLGVWEAIPPEKPDLLLPFVCRIVRNISISHYKRERATKRKGNYDLSLEELGDVVNSNSSAEKVFEAKELSALVDAFLGTLSEMNRFLFVRHFWFLDSYEELTKKTGLREGSIRTRLSRVKKNLRKYLEKKGIVI